MEKEDPPRSKSLENGWKLLLRLLERSVRINTTPDDFNVMEWDILMAITAEDMTSKTLQQRMIPKKTQTKTQVEFQPFTSDFEGGLRFVHTGGRGGIM